MEKKVNFFENGRLPQFFENGRQPQFFQKWKKPLIFCVWKMTSIFDQHSFGGQKFFGGNIFGGSKSCWQSHQNIKSGISQHKHFGSYSHFKLKLK